MSADPELFEIDADGWLQGVRRVPSPNYNQRPCNCSINMVVVHNISLPPGNFGGPYVEDLFLNRLDPSGHPYFAEIAGMQVSSHLFVRRDGEVLQFVSLQDRAWHAGRSCWQGEENCNDFSIGIELEGTDDSPYQDIQYRRLAALIRSIRQRYPEVDRDRIVGHSDIAPDRKTDPGPSFLWSRLTALLAEQG